jgi:probable addiction module antidote protein
MPKRTGSYSSWRNEKLLNPEIAARYLSAAERDSKEAFLDALENVIQSRQVSALAKDAGVTRESVYRSFSETGNPTLENLRNVLGALGLRIMIVPECVSSSGNDSRDGSPR